MSRNQISQGAVDTGVAGTVISYPWWAQFLHDGIEILALGGGVVLVGLRIRLAIIELKQKKRDD